MPLRISITGKKRNLLLNLFEKIFPLKNKFIEITDKIKIDSSRKNEKLLFYFFHNLMRDYSYSPLYKYMEKKLGNDDIFLDIGANLGFYSYLAHKKGCKVILFEPEPTHVDFLKRNNHIFEYVYDIALSANEGEIEFYVGNEENLGGSSLIMSDKGWENSGYSHSIKVKTKRLDKIITDKEIINKIKLAKIDVEGAEKYVVEGMENLLKLNHFDIWCEVRGEQSDRNPGSYKDVCDLLKPYGYRPYIFDGSTISEFSSSYVQQVFDLLFIHENKNM